MNKTIEKLDKRREHLHKLLNLDFKQKFWKEYVPTKGEVRIINALKKLSAKETADKLKINKSYVYAVIGKYKKVHTELDMIDRYGHCH